VRQTGEKNQMLSDRRRKGGWRIENGKGKGGTFSAGHRVGECTHCITKTIARQTSSTDMREHCEKSFPNGIDFNEIQNMAS